MITKNEYIDYSWEHDEPVIKIFVEVSGEEVAYKELPLESIDDDLRSELELIVSDYYSEQYNDKLAEAA